jgi:hypothetical protein
MSLPEEGTEDCGHTHEKGYYVSMARNFLFDRPLVYISHGGVSHALLCEKLFSDFSDEYCGF